ncbi:MAG: carbon storage regulator CsrA [Oligoflexia bacterium]|nr:carbon storage regulator CsrA [Oligoflexia bacterium]
MLILTRKPGESLYIGDHIKVIIVEIKGNQIRVGIDAPAEFRIYREEIYLQILEENKKAAEASMAADSDLEGLTAAWSGRGQDGPAAGKVSTGGVSGTGVSATKLKATSPQVVVKRKKRDE